MNLSTEELFKQMEAGKLLSADVLPKVAKELRRTANSGGALEMRMKSMRVAQGRFFKQVESGADTIFTAGFDIGGGEMFNEMADELDQAASGMKGMGKVFNLVFKVIGSASQFLIPILNSVFYALGLISDVLVELFQHKSGQIAAGIGVIGYAVGGLNGKLGATNTLLTLMMRKIFVLLGPFVAIAVLIEDIMANFDDKKVSSIEAAMGRQFGDNKGAETKDMFRPLKYLSPMVGQGFLLHDRLTAQETVKSAENRTTTNVNVAIDGMDSRLQKELRTVIGLSSVEGRQ